MTSSFKPPGRIGEPDMCLGTDSRARPDLLAVAKPMGLAANIMIPRAGTDIAELAEICKSSHEGFQGVYDSLPNDLPGDDKEPEVEQSEISVDGVDGNKVKLYFFRTKAAGKEHLPAIMHIHGGGMCILNTNSAPDMRLRKSLALHGTVAIGVDFRNAWQPDGNHYHFPAGLNDCAAAVKYVNSHKAELGISKIILQGESGGANLALATALKANREGWIDAIAGVSGYVPYISGVYGWPEEKKLKELPSLVENDGYFVNTPAMDAMARFYSPGKGEMENPLAWPYCATEKDLKGLPPHLICVDELDPLRDEGLVYSRKLQAAGVNATASINAGITHGAALIFRKAMPEMNEKIVTQIAEFAKRV